MSRSFQFMTTSKKLFCSKCLNLSFGCDLGRVKLLGARQYLTSNTFTNGITQKCPLIFPNNFQGYSSIRKEVFKRCYTTNRPPSSSKSRAEDSPVTWKTVAIVGTICGVGLCAFKYVKQEKEQAMRKQKQVGKPLLGGPWELTDHHGKRRSNEDFFGQWILLYFGFTNCPDICPDYVEKIVDFVGQCDANKAMPSIQPIVITVDPERDTVEAMKDYLAEFSPKLLGMTGSKDDINKATRAYRVYYSMGPKDEDNDYIVDHSIISYLVNPKGEFVDYFGQNKTADEMFATTQKHVKKFQP